MDPVDDEDLLLQRTSASYLDSLQRETAAFDAYRNKYADLSSQEQKRLRGRIEKIVGLFDQFQEEPQLLDPQLKRLVPPLTDAFVALVVDVPHDFVMLKAIAECLSTLCKVRGAKIVIRFMDNEARYIQPFVRLGLSTIREKMHLVRAETQANGENATIDTQGREEVQLRYILLLWMSHLVLTPFPLSSVGSVDHLAADERTDWLPESMPPVANNMAVIALASLSSPARDQWCAARLLVNLSLRPDMRKVGLLDRLVKHFLSTLSEPLDAAVTVHTRRGSLSFIDGLLRAASSNDVYGYLADIFRNVMRMVSDEGISSGEVQGSAILRRACIKILRLVVVNLLLGVDSNKAATRAVSARMLDEEAAHQEAIAYLLEALADRDTQVRLASSKALAVITAKLQADLADQVVGAVLEAFDENVHNVVSTGQDVKDLSNVSATKWHGLTLTLAHMLFRRSIRPERISEALKALFSSLAFEQRSSSGSSLGANVRDAANFGLWSLARRYNTGELLNLHLEPDTVHLEVSLIQRTATELLVAACLDSAGNVRRGSSAALQELIGRHPDTVFEGIQVVQRVDYQAVGLRRRAMIDVAFASASLGSSEDKANPYLRPLWNGLLEWRGAEAPDAPSREHAAAALQRLVVLFEGPEARRKLDHIVETLRRARQQGIDSRHGLMLALAAVLNSASAAMLESRDDMLVAFTPFSLELWKLFDDTLRPHSKMFTMKSMKPDLMTAATMTLIQSIASFFLQTVPAGGLQSGADFAPSSSAVEAFTICLKTKDPTTHQVIPQACTLFRMLLPPARMHALRKTCEDQLRLTKTTPRRAGAMIAIASLAYAERCYTGCNSEDVAREDPWLRARAMVIEIFDSVDDIDARISSLHCAAMLVSGPEECASLPNKTVGADARQDLMLDRVIYDGLNDYTINERGDEGSRVRLEALETLLRIYSADETSTQSRVPIDCKLAVQRLALERLDKVRSAAGRALRLWQRDFNTNLDIATEDYFLTLGHQMLTTQIDQSISFEGSSEAVFAVSTAFWTGFASSCGAGSETLIQTARSALYTILDTVPPTALHTILSALLPTLKADISTKNDRVLQPLLETISFLFDAGIFHRHHLLNLEENQPNNDFKWTTLLSLTQKAHFKSSSLEKLSACVQIYRGLVMLPHPSRPTAPTAPPLYAPVPSSPPSSALSSTNPSLTSTNPLQAVRKATLHKLTTMLLHPYPKIRVAVAEVLYVVAASGTSPGTPPDTPLGTPPGTPPGMVTVANSSEVQTLLKDIDWTAPVTRVEVEAEDRTRRVARIQRILGV